MLPTSGTLKLSQVAAEFSEPLPVKFSKFYGVADGIPSSGTMKLSQFYGKYKLLAQIDAYLFDSTAQLDSFKATNVPPTMQSVFNTWGRFSDNAWYPSGTTPGGEAASWAYEEGSTSTTTQKQNLPIFGVKPIGINTAAELSQLDIEYADTNNRRISFTGNDQYAYFCHPVELGIATFVDVAAGFPGGWDGASWPDNGDFGDTYGPLTITRTIGSTTSQWYLYRTDFPMTGSYQFDVAFPNPGLTSYSSITTTVPGGDGKIVTTTNSSTRIGFISSEKLDNYTFEATLASTNPDDDLIGLVVAHKRDGANNIILMAYRANYTASNWVLQLYDGSLATPQVILVNGSNSITTGFQNSTYNGWVTSGPTRIRIQRTGDIIKAWCSPFGSTVIDSTTLIQFDLNSHASTVKLKGLQSYGYMAYSQASSSFTDINLTGGLVSDTVYNTNGQVWKYNGSSWTLDAGTSLLNSIGYPRRVRNPSTGYIFNIDPNGIITRV